MNKKLNKFVEDVRLEVESGKGNITINGKDIYPERIANIRR